MHPGDELVVTDGSVIGAQCLEEGLVSELSHSALCGSVMGREEALQWSWTEESRDDGAQERVIDLLVKQGSILERNGQLTVAGMEHLFGASVNRRRAAGMRLSEGTAFLERLKSRSPELLLAGITGSVSYGSSADADDIDILLIARNGTLWKVLKKALREARDMRRRKPAMPTLCLSYCMEEKAFRREMLNHRTRLFARDFLRLKPVAGKGEYGRMLAECFWMKQFYPGAFGARMRECKECADDGPSATGSRWNLLNYMAVGNYLRLAAAVRNARFRRDGAHHMLFRAIILPDRCIYESNKWKQLEASLSD